MMMLINVKLTNLITEKSSWFENIFQLLKSSIFPGFNGKLRQQKLVLKTDGHVAIIQMSHLS